MVTIIITSAVVSKGYIYSNYTIATSICSRRIKPKMDRSVMKTVKIANNDLDDDEDEEVDIASLVKEQGHRPPQRSAFEVRPPGSCGPQRPGNLVPFTQLDQANALKKKHRERREALQSHVERREYEASQVQFQEARAKEEAKKRKEEEKKRKMEDVKKKKKTPEEQVVAVPAARRDAGKRQLKPTAKAAAAAARHDAA